MGQETKTCQNCEKEFTIEPEDLRFYEKIQVPSPTFCPECRLQRRLAWRNERTLYQRACDLCKKSIIAMYPQDVPFPVYCQECWWSDKWNPLRYGQDYDFSKPFFEQFASLMQSTPRFPLFRKRCTNSDYINIAGDSKNCYLVFGCVRNEDCYYGKIVWDSKNVFDGLYCYNCEFCYEVIDCANCSNLLYSRECRDCRDSAFLEDCVNCTNCFASVGLRNKQYYFRNEKLSKEEYEKRVQEVKENIPEMPLSYPKRFSHFLNVQNSTGDHIIESRNCFESFDLKHSEDGKFITTGINAKNVYDYSYFAYPLELSYEGVTSMSYKMLFSINNFDCLSVSYSMDSYNSENLFGCIGLSKYKHCVLNKRYSKESYNSLIKKIIAHMSEAPFTDKKGRIYRYGEFFPAELSPFAYNETVAQEYFPLSAKSAVKAGYQWREKKRETKKAEGDIIECVHASNCAEQCTGIFRIIPQERSFYQKMHIPLPTLCPNCRHYQRLKKRNPLKLWHRTCDCDREGHFHQESHCPNTFKTSYSPGREEMVYCEQCYSKEVL